MAHAAPITLAAGGRERPLDSERIAQTLLKWQATELRLTRGFAECRGLSTEQLEDFYQDTAIVLIRGHYQSEEHLRNALHWGIKRRALQHHRDERRRSEILAHNKPELDPLDPEREHDSGPELAALISEDRLIVSEFLSELTTLEQRVFWLTAEGMSYRAIARALAIAVNQARNSTRACERKRARFQLLYDTGRLCGYRASTIQAIQDGQGTSEQIAAQAFTHLESCPHCRAQHKTNARRLRRSFQDQAAALLPIPILARPLGWLTRLALRTKSTQQRLLPATPAGGALRERAATLIAGGGLTAKVAVSVATVAVLTGSTLATRALQHHQSHHHHHAPTAHARIATSPAPPEPVLASTATPSTRHHASTPSHTSRSTSAPRFASAHPTPATREPGGFAYLGVPTRHAPATPAPEAHSATETNGGPFSP